jgi:hypothetical protein
MRTETKLGLDRAALAVGSGMLLAGLTSWDVPYLVVGGALTVYGVVRLAGRWVDRKVLELFDDLYP